MNGVAWLILAVILACVAFLVGSYLTPGVNSAVLATDTAQFGYIQLAIHRATPFLFPGAMLLGIIFLLTRRNEQ